ncbi:MAG: hypothetical protein NZ699_12535 [Roseiflexus sp.]|nr:hypothetical protein [Roseiflexus sp.]MCS7289950.1 hypothetical protein [Roseiflexus sp.]MDW8146890.1 hypothetical protein [Roseiflexaceae bacterium]MDW8233361.1 hypothetical protein [Roseiflexaceae bacterium]
MNVPEFQAGLSTILVRMEHGFTLMRRIDTDLPVVEVLMRQTGDATKSVPEE